MNDNYQDAQEMRDFAAQAAPKTTAESIVLQAQKIAAFSQLYMFVKAVNHGPAAETGVQVFLDVQNQQRTNLFVNSKLLLDALIAEFNRLGQELEADNVDTSGLLQGLEQRFQSLYK